MTKVPSQAAPDGAGRPQAVRSASLASDYFEPVPIYVPTKPWIGSPFGVLPGSAIVGVRRPDDVPDTIVVYFEGNLCGTEYFSRFAIRCLHAHGRMAQRYPTVARARILFCNLVEVGIWHPREKVVEVTNMDLLSEWCGWTLPVSADQLNARG